MSIFPLQAVTTVITEITNGIKDNWLIIIGAFAIISVWSFIMALFEEDANLKHLDHERRSIAARVGWMNRRKGI